MQPQGAETPGVTTCEKMKHHMSLVTSKIIMPDTEVRHWYAANCSKTSPGATCSWAAFQRSPQRAQMTSARTSSLTDNGKLECVEVQDPPGQTSMVVCMDV